MPNKAIPPVVQALCDGHALFMKSGALTLRWLDRANGNPYDPDNLRIANEAASMAHLTARLMQHQQSAHGLWLRARHLPGMAVFGRAPIARPRETAVPAKLHATAGLARGRLNNGNPSGDYLKSPRCCARTRAGGSCRQPAMRNGRCRMHGGLSTGPRTAEGLRRSRYSRYVHGFRSRPVLRFRRHAVHTARHLRDLTAALRAALRQDSRLRAAEESRGGGVPAGHGLHRPDSISQAGARSKSALTAASPDSLRSHLRSSMSICGSNPFPAGQGVHRPDFIRDLSAHPRAAAC